MTLEEFQAKASPGQLAVLRCKKRFPIVVTGIQAGKTTVGGVWLCDKIYKDYSAGIKGDYLIAAPTVKILQQSTLPKFREVFPSDWGEWKEGSKIFQLKWGGRIFVRSTDDPDYLEGMTIRAAWLDEAGQMKQMVWTNIQGRLSIAQGPCLMTTTPYNMGWFHRDIQKKISSLWQQDDEGKISETINPDGDDTLAGFNWASVNNPAFSRDEYDRMKRSLSPSMFDRRYRGKFTQLEGLILPNFKVCDPFVCPPEWPAFGGMDFGQTHPAAIMVVRENPQDHEFYVTKEFYKAGASLAQMAGFIQDNGLREVEGDPQSAQLIKELKDSFHINILPANNDVALGIQKLYQLFAEGRLHIFSSCTNLIDELESYHRAMDNEGNVTEKPVKAHDDAVDALRYAFAKEKRKVHGRLDPLNTLGRRGNRFANQIRRSDIITDSYTGY